MTHHSKLPPEANKAGLICSIKGKLGLISAGERIGEFNNLSGASSLLFKAIFSSLVYKFS